MKEILFVLFVVQPFISAAQFGYEYKDGKREFAPIQQKIEALNKELDAITDSLIEMALDTNVHDERRRHAIFSLGKINTQKSIQFLFDHYDLYIYKSEYLHDDDEFKERPCEYALARGKKEAVIPVFLQELAKEEKSYKEIIYLFNMLVHNYGRPASYQLYDKHIESIGIYLKNLQELRKIN